MEKVKKYCSLLLLLPIFLLLVACGSTKEESVTLDEEWDREVDVCVIGYGLAGAAAAVEANDIDPEAEILILEKMPVEAAGGNSIASGQTFLVPQKEDMETFQKYIKACNEPNPIPEDYLDFWTNEMSDQIGWIVETMDQVNYEVGYVGGGPMEWGNMVVEFPDLEGADFVGTSAHIREKDGPTFEDGGVWRGFSKVVEDRGLEVLYDTPAVELVQDPDTREVLGVIAETIEGESMRIKASEGVIMACGGFENNLEMQRNFHGMDEVYTSGTPGNTGDGIEMLQLAGAKLWHMNNHTQSGGFWLGIKVPDFESAFIRQMRFETGSWLEVDANSERFYDEGKLYHGQHMKYKEHGRYVDLPHQRALPVDLIFDETTRKGDTIVTPWLSWPITTEGYEWSTDNQEEIDKGWIIQADTIEELAEKIGRDPEKLKETIDRYNEMVEAGEDTDFGRDADTMTKIENGPFYSVSLTPALVSTTGGAKRDINSRVLDWDDEPIPNLYSAGELGSYVSNLYQNGIYLSEAILSGRAASQDILGGKSSVTREVMIEEASEEVEEELTYIDGVYEVEVEDTSGVFTIAATVEDGDIINLEIIDGVENAYITDEQLEEFESAILKEQTVDVEAISGATMSCNSISDALREVLEVQE